MIFTIQNLGFAIGGFLLEGWLAFAARCVCALVLLALGAVARALLRKKIFPKLLTHSWHFEATGILLRSFALPAERMVWLTGIYFALASLPWAIAPVPKFLLVVYQMAMTLCICKGLYHASDVATLLLKSCGEEIRSNKTLLSLLDTTYKVLVVILGVATIAQESGFPIGSIVAGAGLIGLTISLAAQETASNIFSGIVILIDKPFAVGDWILVGDVEGEVIDINFRSIKIRSLDKTVSVITNSKVCSSTIVNCAMRSTRPYKFTLGVTYNTSRAKLEQLMADLTAMLEASPSVEKGSALVRLTSFGDSSINLLVSAYLLTNQAGTFLQMQNDLNLNVMDVMQKNNVDFAFPSTTVYLSKEFFAPPCGGAFFVYNATSSAIIQANPNTMLMTPADSSGSTACGIISCAVTQTMHPAAALISQGRAALTQPATARASSPPSGSTSPEAAPARKALPRL